MIAIQDKLVSDDIVKEAFLCDLNACKGACCWEGDFGAPITKEEEHKIEAIYSEVAPYLTEAGKQCIEENGISQRYVDQDRTILGTPILKSGACAFMTYKNGIAQCGIEAAFLDKKIDYRKPISCHLYPIRVLSQPELGFEALNYDRWDICKAACANGKKEKLPVYKFAKNALVRKYGLEFYEELDAAATHLKERQ